MSNVGKYALISSNTVCHAFRPFVFKIVKETAQSVTVIRIDKEGQRANKEEPKEKPFRKNSVLLMSDSFDELNEFVERNIKLGDEYFALMKRKNELLEEIKGHETK